jgi:hypothetical protein
LAAAASVALRVRTRFINAVLKLVNTNETQPAKQAYLSIIFVYKTRIAA